MRRNGWYRESYRHALAARGVTTRKYAAAKTSVGRALERVLKDYDTRRKRVATVGDLEERQKLNVQQKAINVPLSGERKKLFVRDQNGELKRYTGVYIEGDDGTLRGKDFRPLFVATGNRARFEDILSEKEQKALLLENARREVVSRGGGRRRVAQKQVKPQVIVVRDDKKQQQVPDEEKVIASVRPQFVIAREGKQSSAGDKVVKTVRPTFVRDGDVAGKS